MRNIETLDTFIVARLLAMGAVALAAFAFFLTIGLASAGSLMEWVIGGSMVAAAIAAAVACFRASTHFYHPDRVSGDQTRRLAPVRIKR